MKYEINNQSFNEQVYLVIKEKIIRNELKAGEKLNVANIAKALGVSRTPVANAMKSLERDGYVIILPQNGTYVKNLTSKEIDIIYKFRAALEGLIIEFSVNKIDHMILKEYLVKFNAFNSIKVFNEDLLRKFYDLELDLHRFLVSYCPEVVRKEIQNIVDLTRKSRFINLENELRTQNTTFIKENEIRIHEMLIQSILNCDMASAKKLAKKDVMRTRDSVLEIMLKDKK